MHRLLERQLRRHFGSVEAVPEGLAKFLAAVDQAYEDFDDHCRLVERSMELSAQELLQANAEMRAVLSAFPDLFIWVDEDDTIVNVQAGDPGDLVVGVHELLGRRVDTIPIEGLGEKFAAAIERVRQTGRSISIDYRLPETDADYEARILPLIGGQIIVIVRNITDRKRLEDAVEANKAKSAFLANISHELRTPLHGILSFGRLGQSRLRTRPDKVEKYFDYIVDGGETLLTLLNDLLDLSKLDAGKMRFELRTGDARKTVTHVVDQFASRVAEMQLSVVWNEPTEPMVGRIDPARLGQVIRNLLSNAVRFSQPDGEIRVVLVRDDDDLLFHVRDEGTGIPEDELESIFEKFTQSSITKTGAGGTGLGLSICREIVRAHGGRIWAENVPDGGAVFSFRIPSFAAATSSLDSTTGLVRDTDETPATNVAEEPGQSGGLAG
jgi:signal transduction histidine kinase